MISDVTQIRARMTLAEKPLLLYRSMMAKYSHEKFLFVELRVHDELACEVAMLVNAHESIGPACGIISFDIYLCVVILSIRHRQCALTFEKSLYTPGVLQPHSHILESIRELSGLPLPFIDVIQDK
jgi:hypothetical protein